MLVRHDVSPDGASSTLYTRRCRDAPSHSNQSRWTSEADTGRKVSQSTREQVFVFTGSEWGGIGIQNVEDYESSKLQK